MTPWSPPGWAFIIAIYTECQATFLETRNQGLVTSHSCRTRGDPFGKPSWVTLAVGKWLGGWVSVGTKRGTRAKGRTAQMAQSSQEIKYK